MKGGVWDGLNLAPALLESLGSDWRWAASRAAGVRGSLLLPRPWAVSESWPWKGGGASWAGGTQLGGQSAPTPCGASSLLGHHQSVAQAC